MLGRLQLRPNSPPQLLLLIQPLLRKFISIPLGYCRYLTSKYSIEQFDTLVKELMEGDVSQKHHGLIGIRKLVSVVDNVEVMIKKVVASGAVPTLIHLMTQPDHPQLKLEAAWAITNVMTSTGDECELVI